VEYFQVKLQTAIEMMTVERVEQILSTFSCERNDDIEQFLKKRAIDFSNKGIARTHLVLRETTDGFALLGYYALTNKILTISPDKISNSIKQRIERYGILDKITSIYSIATPLIAQLGKNYADKTSCSISGDELLQIACDKVASIQEELGGKLVYLECEDRPKLIEFYTRNGFRIMASGTPSGKGLVQMLRFL
jgi:hypothetical protein